MNKKWYSLWEGELSELATDIKVYVGRTKKSSIFLLYLKNKNKNMLNQIETKSEQEVIQILQEHGIQVIMKPVALLPNNLYNYYDYSMESVGIVETDIYDALNRIQTRKRVIGDPFSK